jgi:hypothetical protein
MPPAERVARYRQLIQIKYSRAEAVDTSSLNWYLSTE